MLRIETAVVDPQAHRRAFLEDVRAGLLRYPKSIPSKYFYDERGSELFERITTLPEYYLTRTELSIMETSAGEMAALFPEGGALIEFGSGASLKTRFLLDRARQLAAYVPIDVSASALERAASELAVAYPSLVIAPINADYMGEFLLPSSIEKRPKVGYFPGSTIGNLKPAGSIDFLRRTGAVLTRGSPPGHVAGGRHGAMLIGIDLDKDPAVLDAAYNDRDGVTAEFNLNLLRRINRELGASFDLSAFYHIAFYDPDRRRIEMRLVSRRAQEVEIGGTAIPFEAGESILTEYSYKYDIDGFSRLASEGGFAVKRTWTDPERLVAVVYLQPAPRAMDTDPAAGR